MPVLRATGKMSAVYAFKVPKSELFFMLCNQFPHCRDKLIRDLHDCLVLFRKRSFILGHGFLGGRLKTGHAWTGQNRPTELVRDGVVVSCQRLCPQVLFARRTA